MAMTPERPAEDDFQAVGPNRQAAGGEAAGGVEAAGVEEAVDDEAGDREMIDQKPDWWTILRRGAAGAIAFSAVAIFLASIWVPNLRVCKETAGGTTFANATSCNPWGLNELLPVLLLAALLILPDFSELSIFNLVTFKRELKAQKQELNATAARQTALESQVVGQLAQLSSVQNVNVHYVDPANLADAIQEKKDSSLRRTRGAEREASAYGGTRAATAMDLLAEWEVLAERFGLGRPRDRYMLNDELHRFLTVFRDEIDTVRRVRNSVAHNIYVDETVLGNALSAARELNSILSSKS